LFEGVGWVAWLWPGAGSHLPGDYWTFAVRAQGIPNPQILINATKPQGDSLSPCTAGGDHLGKRRPRLFGEYRRLPHHCAAAFPQQGLLYLPRGRWHSQLRNFTSIQFAIDSLSPEGGEVCILPGRYFENVRIVNRRDIVIHGCGWQTRIASASLGSIEIELKAKSSANSAGNPIAAVITIIASQHVELRSFAVEAADDEAGILLDGTGTTLPTNQTPPSAIRIREAAAVSLCGVIDVLIENLVLLAAGLPAVLAESVELLRIHHNRVMMKNVRGLWPAVYASGQEICIEHNWVGILSVTTAREYCQSRPLKMRAACRTYPQAAAGHNWRTLHHYQHAGARICRKRVKPS
jgi:hypothetical protein